MNLNFDLSFAVECSDFEFYEEFSNLEEALSMFNKFTSPDVHLRLVFRTSDSAFSVALM